MTEEQLEAIAAQWAKAVVPLLAHATSPEDFVATNAKGPSVEHLGDVDSVAAVSLPLHQSAELEVNLELDVDSYDVEFGPTWAGYIWVEHKKNRTLACKKINTNGDSDAHFALIALARHLWPEEL